jgi:hypothetical protein
MGTGKGRFDYRGYRVKIDQVMTPTFGGLYETEITEIGNESEPLTFQPPVIRDITVATANARGFIDALLRARDLENQTMAEEAYRRNAETPLGESIDGGQEDGL